MRWVNFKFQLGCVKANKICGVACLPSPSYLLWYRSHNQECGSEANPAGSSLFTTRFIHTDSSITTNKID